MKLLILGAGGVGGYFGGRLVEAGADVTFLVRPARQAQLAEQGLRIISPHGNASLQVRTVTRDALRQEFDLVILAPKAYDLDDALQSVAPAIGANTALLPLLNGVRHMEVLDQHFGRERILGGVAHIAAVMTSDGAVAQLTKMHSLTAGGRDARTQALAERLIAVCKPARFDSVLSTDIESALWAKWVFLAALAGMTTLMRASVGDIVATPQGAALMHRMYQECLSTAEAAGHAIAAEARQQALAMLQKAASPLTASMLRDMEAGLRTEHAHVLGDMLRRAEAAGVDAPLLAASLTQLEIERAAA